MSMFIASPPVGPQGMVLAKGYPVHFMANGGFEFRSNQDMGGTSTGACSIV